MKIFNFDISIIKRTKSVEEVKEEIKNLDKPVLSGWAFLQPLESYSYDYRIGRKVITEYGIGEIVGYYKEEYLVDVYVYSVKYVKHCHARSVFIIVVLNKNGKLIPLSPHDYEHLTLSTVGFKSFYIEFQYTKHGNVKLTESFKNQIKNEQIKT